MDANQKTHEVQRTINSRTGVWVSFDDASTLRRAAMTLHRWNELECGDGNDYASWAIERDEATGIPYMARHPNTGKPSRARIPDRETGALRRIAETCKANGLYWYHQTDPRGCALYVSNEPLTDEAYTRGVAI